MLKLPAAIPHTGTMTFRASACICNDWIPSATCNRLWNSMSHIQRVPPFALASMATSCIDLALGSQCSRRSADLLKAGDAAGDPQPARHRKGQAPEPRPLAAPSGHNTDRHEPTRQFDEARQEKSSASQVSINNWSMQDGGNASGDLTVPGKTPCSSITFMHMHL